MDFTKNVDHLRPTELAAICAGLLTAQATCDLDDFHVVAGLYGEFYAAGVRNCGKTVFGQMVQAETQKIVKFFQNS